MEFVVEWKSLQPKESIAFFLAGAHKPIAGVKILQSLHTLGKPEGFAVVEAEPEVMHGLVLALPPGMFEATVTPVLSDDLATKALASRHASLK